jgi:hypothetical protein
VDADCFVYVNDIMTYESTVVCQRESEPILAERLGLSVHVSALRIKIGTLIERYPSPTSVCVEDWLLDVANRRGARIVFRDPPAPAGFRPPPENELSTEELVVAVCQLQGRDRPQLLRLAAQLISRGKLDLVALRRVATRERAGSVLKAMADEALKVAPGDSSWSFLGRVFALSPRPRDVVIHWTRLAEPVMTGGRVNAGSWRLVA